MKRNAIISIIIACFLGVQISVAASFSDVSPTNPNYNAIEYLKTKGIVKGYADGSFKPTQPVNRAEALKMIFIAAGITPETPTVSYFPDIKLGDWFAPYIMTGKKKNIVNGDSTTGLFGAGRTVIKAEFLKMLLLSFNKDISKHLNTTGVSADVPDSAWFKPYMSYSKAINIIIPNAENQLLPSKTLSRGECAEIIYQLLLIEKGGNVQKLLNLTESSLISVLLSLSVDDVVNAKLGVQNAVAYSQNALNAAPNEGIVKAAHEISLAMQDLVLGYEAGLVQDWTKVTTYANAAKIKAGTAYNYNNSTQAIGKKIKSYADSLLSQRK